MPSTDRQNRRRSLMAALAALALAGALAGQPARAADTAATTATSPTRPPTATATATPPSSANATDRCLDAADEAALLACRKATHAEATRALRQAVDKLQQRLRDDDPEHLKLFNTAQQAWRQYSQAECRFRHRESAGGAAYPAYLLSCATELSHQRLQALQAVIAKP